MEYKGLENLRNTYPGEIDTVTDSYTSEEGAIKFSGKYPENFIKFQVVSLDDILLDTINIDPKHSFRFIIRFINEDGITFEDWASEPFLNDLHTAQSDNNPFFSRDRVTVAEIHASSLTQYWQLCKFKQGEDYAEVIIRDTITTKEDILEHINWIVGSDEDLRPINEIGRWSIHTREWNLGFKEDKRSIIPLLGPPLLDDICDDENSDGDTSSGGIITSDVTSIDTYPFTTPGRYIGEIRIEIGTGISWTWTVDGWSQ